MGKKKVRATRTNGRKDSSGVFKAGHNDRSFNLESAEHVDAYLTWDCVDFDNRVITVKQTIAYLPGMGITHSMSFISLRHRQDFARFQ